MLSHDNLAWLTRSWSAMMERDRPESVGQHNRIVSYLPLSHIAGLFFDLILQMGFACEVFFARPDALQGSLVDTLRWGRPTSFFFAVPRVWEKLEERVKIFAAANPNIVKNNINWAREELGLNNCIYFSFGAAPMKQATVDFFKPLNMLLFNEYGMSEVTGPHTIQL